MISKACIVGIYQRKLELIARRGIDLHVVVPPSWKDERGEMLLERAYTEGYCLDVLPIRWNGNFHLHHYVNLGAKMRQLHPDIVHIDEEPYNLAAWQILFHARRAGAKTVFFSWQNLNRNYPPPFNWGERWFIKRVDYAIMGTESAGDIWREKGYTGPSVTTPQFGIDPDLFQPAHTRPDRPFTIGYIGRLVEEKGLHLLLEVVAELEGNWRLKILGGGPLLEQYKQQTAQLRIEASVCFDGQVPSIEMPDYYHALDVLVLPSLTRPNWKEQFGRVLVEAMASGVPVIGSDSGAIPGVIGEAGLIFPEGDGTSLYKRLKRLQKNAGLRQAFATAGRERVLKHFTHQQVADETVTVYEKVMSKL